MSPLPRRKAWHFEDEYGSLDYTGAVVLDIGADYGCTAEFFLERGASFVIAVEKNPEWREQLRAWAADKDVMVLPSELSEASARAYIATLPDIVKCDCEGAESYLLGVEDRLLGSPRAWIMETHTLELYRLFVTRFERLGYTVTMVRDFGDEPNAQGKTCKVFKAER